MKDNYLNKLLGAQEKILLVTRQGMSIRFAADTVPAMGRVAGGVKCIKLDKGDGVVYASQLPNDGAGDLITITDRGYGKRSPLFDYDLQGRNGKGLRAFDFKKNGSNGSAVAAVFYAGEPREFTVLQRHGGRTMLSTDALRVEPRFSKGAPLVAVVLDDDVVGVEE